MPQHAGPADPTEPARPAEPEVLAATADPLSYEQARDELVEVVRRLETGGTSLEEALALWERGEELAAVCERFLEGARARLDAAVAAREEAGRG
ncbi:MAG TPA: exodeoxyribonuclease VII small subunit [Jiangellales bacterium]|nr:exodeoxyribonuclease VII small subunit [Jiangellales bacterium]